MVTSSRIRPPGLPTEAEILGRAGGENFTVASRLLPATSRDRLLAFYGYARLVDQIGDDYDGDRAAALDWVDAEVDLAWSDPTAAGLHPLVARAARAAQRSGAPAAWLHDLVAANRLDQTTTRWATWDALRSYCRLSAEPVGRLVLAAFDASTPEREARSDDVCSALQVIEHLQDVAEDALAGRIYLPGEDLRRFGVTDDDVVGHARDRSPAPAPLRAVIAFEAARARTLLDDGAVLVADLGGRDRVAVAGFAAGGYAALDALAAVRYDPFPTTPRPRPARVLSHLVRLLRGASPAGER